MTIEDVQETIEKIKRLVWDDAAAHEMEDLLYQDVLATIAGGYRGTLPSELAMAALKSREIVFDRWYE